ncbi:MAG: NUDIX hydrolase [Candidatus Dormibacteraceae bacterium]
MFRRAELRLARYVYAEPDMTPAEIIEQLRRGLVADPPPNSRWSVAGRVDGAVAVPLQPAGDDLVIWLTKRADGLRHHAREISFPGGQREPEDPSLLAAALRELEEEVGVPASAVQVLGPLAPVPTATSNFLLNPFLVVLRSDQQASPSVREVAELVRLSVDSVLAGRVSFAAIELGDHRSPIFDFGGRIGSVYGATAYVLEEVLRRCAEITQRKMPEPTLTEEIPWN